MTEGASAEWRPQAGGRSQRCRVERQARLQEDLLGVLPADLQIVPVHQEVADLRTAAAAVDIAEAAGLLAVLLGQVGLRDKKTEHPKHTTRQHFVHYSLNCERLLSKHVQTNISAISLWWVSRALVVRRRAVRRGAIWSRTIRLLLTV